MLRWCMLQIRLEPNGVGLALALALAVTAGCASSDETSTPAQTEPACQGGERLCLAGDQWHCGADGKVVFEQACYGHGCVDGACVPGPEPDIVEAPEVNIPDHGPLPDLNPAPDPGGDTTGDGTTDGAGDVDEPDGTGTGGPDDMVSGDVDGQGPDDVDPTDSAPGDTAADDVGPEDVAPPDTGPVCTPGEAPSLISDWAWQKVDEAADPWFDSEAGYGVCQPTFDYEVESYLPIMDTDAFAVTTVTCNFATVSQPLVHDIPAATLVTIAMHHTKLGPAEGTYTVAVALGDPPATQFQTTVAIPTNSGFIKAQFEAKQCWPKGTPITWHIDNHGFNAWVMLDIATEDVVLPAESDPLPDGACSNPYDSPLHFDDGAISDTHDTCLGQCPPMGGTNEVCMLACLDDVYTPGCAVCHAGFIGCFLQTCTCPGAGCANCIYDICKPQFEACGGVELPMGG
jgi:hypothetical protein